MAEEPLNPCCAVFKEKLRKSQENRNALRKAIKILDDQLKTIESKNASVTTLLEKEQSRVSAEIEAKAKETAARLELENEISVLTSTISSLRENVDSRGQNEDLLQSRVLEGEREINHLKTLLESEKKRVESEKKKVEAEKKKTAEAWKLVKAEKVKAEEQKKLEGVEKNKLKEFKLSLEALKVEAGEARAEMISLKSKNDVAQKALEAEKKRADKEKERADVEKAKADQQKKCAEEERKNAVNERCRSEQLSLQLEEEKLRNRKLQKELDEKIKSTKTTAMVHEPKLSLEALEVEVSKARPELVSLRSKNEIAPMRLAVKQPKANREKKHADSEKAVDEKSQGYHFSEQLEKERQKNKELEKKIHELISANRLEKGDTVLSASSKKASSADVRLLKEQLKLERMHVKHAKKVAKLEKTRNNLLHQEVCRLKQDLFQFYHRLNVLDGCFSHSPEGIDASAKISNTFGPHVSNRKGNNSGGSCTKPGSGISSELESLLGGSDRNKSQTSAKYSTSTSFSDRTLVGSQERGDFAVTSSKFVEENPNNVQSISRLSEKITTLRCDKNLGVVAENNVTGPAKKETASTRLTSHRHEENNVVGGLPVGARKKKRSRATVESDDCMRRDNKFLKHMDGKLDMMLKSNLPSATKSIAPEVEQQEVPDSLFVKNHESRKRKAALQKRELILEPQAKAGRQKPSQNLGVEVSDSAKVCTQGVSNVNQFPESIEAGEDELVGAFRGSENSGVRFEDMGFEDFMKLLELDNPADEERYKMAIEMPLSPTLPEINSPDLEPYSLDSCHDLVEGNANGRLTTLQLDNPADKERHRMATEMPFSPTLPEINSPNTILSEIDSSCDLLEGNVHGRLATTEDNLVKLCRFKTVDMKTDSNKLISNKSSATECRGPLINICSNNSVEALNNKEDEFHTATDEGRTCAHHVMESTAATPVPKQTLCSGVGEKEVLCARDGGSNNKRISNCCVAFSTMTGKSRVSRIVRATISCISEISLDSQTHWIAHKILLALAKEQDLLPEERACVFVSLLLRNISVVTSVKLENYSTEDVSLCSESFAAHIQEVIAEPDMKHIFVELIRTDILISLIQDFLIDRRVLSYNELCQESGFPCDSGSAFLVNGSTISVISKIATIDQLMIGSIALASISSAMGFIDFIREASYDIIRKHIPDSFFVLTILHVFAFVCGKQYFSSDSDSLIVTIIKSIVVLLERGHEMVNSECVSDLSSASEGQPRFPRCSQCKFSEGVVPVDKAMLLLLEKLHTYSVTGTKNLAKGEREPGHEVCIHGIDFDGGLATDGLDSVVNRRTCDFDDIISSLELLSRFTGWRWICSETIPQLLKMLESCVSEKFSAAIIILLGQLGRLGVDDSGSEQTGVEELRSSLSSFFSQTPTEKSNYPVQLSAVYSLIGLLKVEFVQIIQNIEEILIDKDGSGPYVTLIRRWFAQLNEEEKFSTLAFFKPESILES